MDFKVNTTTGAPKTDKKKKTSSAGQAGAAAFSSLLTQTDSASNTQETTPIAAPASVHGILVEEDSAQPLIPTEPEARSKYMLDALEELEQDILTGNPTQGIQKLKNALATTSKGYDALSPAQKEIADEIDLRASIEIAKIEQDS